MTFTSLGSNFGATFCTNISRQADDTQEDDTYAWRVRKVVCLLRWWFLVEEVVKLLFEAQNSKESLTTVLAWRALALICHKSRASLCAVQDAGSTQFNHTVSIAL